MTLPIPQPGLVIAYSYLWHYQQHDGVEEGSKNRPCVIILAVKKQDNEIIVTVAPFTHRQPSEKDSAIEIPGNVKKHLGLDVDSSWVITQEVNQFLWPGHDLQFIPGGRGRAYGFLPPRLFGSIKTALAERIAKRRLIVVRRN